MVTTIKQEIRGVWIVNYSHSQVLTSQSQISKALDFLQESGFNVVFPAVWNRGFTAFPSQVMINHGFPAQDPFYAEKNFDPLLEIITQAKLRKIAIIPWFEYGFAASPDLNGGHILQQKSQWSALDQKGDKVRHGGLTWMNSLDPEVQQFMLDLVLEVINNYDVDGIQGCDRFPALPYTGGYDQKTKNQYQAKFNQLPPNNEKEPQWVQFRAAILTQFLAQIHQKVKQINSNLMVSMSPAVYPFCLNHLMQDYPTWVKQNIVDFLHPQLYRESFNHLTRSKYKLEIDKIKKDFSDPKTLSKIAPGIAFTANNINLPIQDILNCVKYNRKNGLGGQVFFYYEGLKKNNDEIAIALQTQGDYSKT